MDGFANGADTAGDRNERGRFVVGNNAHRNGRDRKSARLLAKFEQLAGAYEGGINALSVIDAGRLRLAAKHLLIAEDTTDPNQCTRSTRAAEMLLVRIKPKETLLPTLDELLAE
jgi:hypothetical protein